jgi:AcrR family transcriptional regulator
VLKRGVKDLNLAEIAEKAHVGKGTAYMYWNTKEDLLLAVITTNHEKTEEMT